MGRYHVTVYAISKNESAFVDRWMDSMSEADDIVVLDTDYSVIQTYCMGEPKL